MSNFANSPTPAVRRSRLARQENKRMARQSIYIIAGIVSFIIFFFWFGIPSLINLAVTLGNAKTSKVTQQEDTLAPLPPQFNPLPTATSGASLIISGSAETGTTITLFQNTKQVSQTITDNQGNFTFANITLSKGQNEFSSSATDEAGNQSQKNVPQLVTFSDEPPQLTIDQPQDNAEVTGTLQQLITIKGSTTMETSVSVNDRQLVVNGDGSFTAKYQLQDGDNTLHFVATDQAGNQTSQDIHVHFAK
jgi:hypothetical protein